LPVNCTHYDGAGLLSYRLVQPSRHSRQFSTSCRHNVVYAFVGGSVRAAFSAGAHSRTPHLETLRALQRTTGRKLALARHYGIGEQRCWAVYSQFVPPTHQAAEGRPSLMSTPVSRASWERCRDVRLTLPVRGVATHCGFYATARGRILAAASFWTGVPSRGRGSLLSLPTAAACHSLHLPPAAICFSLPACLHRYHILSPAASLVYRTLRTRHRLHHSLLPPAHLHLRARA